MVLNTYFSHWLSFRTYLKKAFLISRFLLKPSKSTTFQLPQQINSYKAQMAPQTGSAACKQAATTSSQESDRRKDIKPKVAQDIPESKTTPTKPKPMSNPFCMSKEQVDRIFDELAHLSILPLPHATPIDEHSEKLPALLPAELDYMVILLASFDTPPPGPEARVMNAQPIDWSTVTAKFNDKFSHCQPRTEQALKFAMRANWYDIVIAIFRERSRRVSAGEDIAGVYGHMPPSDFFRLLISLCPGGGLRRGGHPNL